MFLHSRKCQISHELLQVRRVLSSLITQPSLFTVKDYTSFAFYKFYISYIMSSRLVIPLSPLFLNNFLLYIKVF